MDHDEGKGLKCSHKLTFDTKKEADGAAVYAMHQHGRSTRLVAYKCKYCGLWHLATKYDD